MFEAQALHRIGELYIDAEVVGVQLELATLEQAAIRIDVHRQRRNRSIERETPVAIATWISLKVDHAVASYGR
jgi:hypothetical protein